MIFDLVLLRGTKQADGSYRYMSHIQRSRLETRVFNSEEEMLAVVNSVLATQKNNPSVNDDVLHLIQSPDGYQWTALDLTEEQAASLGWKS